MANISIRGWGGAWSPPANSDQGLLEDTAGGVLSPVPQLLPLVEGWANFLTGWVTMASKM